ncbi:aminodeoxychorismate lyase [Apiospora aurea]|uniref:Aminodeoxychorismate lyase n=1 Tax=Apiospora aurea TaxID=335848 RepID=A0ABR1Q1K6_9PEZI
MDEFKLFTTLRYDPALLAVPEQGFTNLGWNQRPSPFYILDYHRDRMLQAATHFRWEAAVKLISGEEGLRRLEEYLDTAASSFSHVPHRVKVTLGRDGQLAHEAAPINNVPLQNLFPTALPGLLVTDVQGDRFDHGEKVATRGAEWQVLVDGKSTESSEYTHFKTTERRVYDDARNRVELRPTDMREVLLVNATNGQVMEASLTTPYFWRGGKWVTPPVPRNFVQGEGSGGNNGTSRRWALERGLAIEEATLANDLVDGEECWLSNGARGFMPGRVKLPESLK